MDAGILALILGFGGGVLTPVGIAIGKYVSQAITMQTLKLGNAKSDQTKKDVEIAVAAAGQMAKAGQITRDQRKDTAMGIARKLTMTHKTGADDEQLNVLVEATVGLLNSIQEAGETASSPTALPLSSSPVAGGTSTGGNLTISPGAVG